MKFLLSTLALLVAVCSAQANEITYSHAKFVGTVQISQSYTMTCLELQCPPSQPFYYVQLKDVRIDNPAVQIESLDFESMDAGLGSEKAPDFIEFNGVQVHNDDVVEIDADLALLDTIHYYFPQHVYAVKKLR